MRSRSLLPAPLLVVLALGLAAAPAAAQTAGKGKPAPAAASPAQKPLAETLTGEAKTAYEEGKVLFLADDPGNALLKFQRSHELSNDPRLLWNIALCYQKLRRYTKMVATLERMLAEGSDRITAEDRRDAEDARDIVRGFISPLRITVSEPGAEVFIDDEKIGASPVGPQQVDVGKHRVRVVKPGFREFTQEVVIAGADGMAVVATLERDIHEGRLVVEAGPSDSIAMDGRLVGRGRWEGTVPSGGHALRITGEGMTPYQTEVVVRDNQTRRVQVTLTPLPTDTVARWLWIAGGAALLTGAVVGAVVLFQPSDRTVGGTIDPPGKIELRFGGGRW